MYNKLENIYLIDTTLRDGEQAPGVSFSLEEKLKIASLLNELGIDEVEAGTPAIGSEERQSIKAIANAGFSFKTSSWCRAKEEDIKQAAILGTDAINISLPSSDIQINALGKTRKWILQQTREMVTIAKDYFPHVTMGAQDGSRSEISFLNEFISVALDNDADRIRVSDTVGSCDPMDIFDLFSTLKKNFSETEFEIHAHNDLGMATANTIAALKAGASCASATINGLGERAGNAVIEELVAYLNSRLIINKYQTKKIRLISDTVAEYSNKKLLENKPVTGVNAYNHESGIHTSAIIKNRETYQFLNPVDYGLKGLSFTFGKHSGSASIKELFKRKSIETDDLTMQNLLFVVKRRAINRKSALTEEEVLEIFFEMIGQRSKVE